MVRSTFAGFTTAQLALSASQRALDVTGQNISNVNTAGYTRQRLDLASISPTGHSYFQMQTDCIRFWISSTGTSWLKWEQSMRRTAFCRILEIFLMRWTQKA